MKSSGQQLKKYVASVQLQGLALQLAFLKKNGASGEASTWKMEKSPENLEGIKTSRPGQKHGRI